MFFPSPPQLRGPEGRRAGVPLPAMALLALWLKTHSLPPPRDTGSPDGGCPDVVPSSPQRLANSKAHTSRFISANLPCNKFKNRLVNIMPYESTRVCLQPIRGVEGSDYINASFIDGYR